ncbi:MAG: hypothetical protein JWR26_643 [Pedosphaera sp.]|nr:hypothetical protein [Pedosphaera sp.]
MKKLCLLMLATAGVFGSPRAHAISLDDIQCWTGSGSNRAALVIEWSTPAVMNATTVPAPVSDKTLVWGYRFNGTATGTQMFNAIRAADPRLYIVQDTSFGTFVEAIGYNLSGDGVIGVTDGTHTYTAGAFTNGALTGPNLTLDAAHAVNGGDLFWSGYFGPNWEIWNEQGDNGGFAASPNRGTNAVWTPHDPMNPFSGSHGQWDYAQSGLDGLVLHDGSWIGYSVAAGGDNYLDSNDPGTIAYEFDKHAPPSPSGTMAAFVYNTNDFATQVVSSSGMFTTPYDDPTAVLGRPTLKFVDHFGDKTNHRSKIVEPPYWTAPDGSKVITEITNGGQITVKLGRKVYDDPNNPYGVDLVVYGNSFYSASGTSGFVGDKTDLDVAVLGTGVFGHGTTVSVSQDGTNWYAFPTKPVIFPDNAYRWDGTNHSWTDEPMNPTKPLNPAITTASLGGQTVANGLEQFMGASGGTGYDLQGSGLPWIQYVKVEPAAGSYTVIDAIAAVDPTVVGDVLSITPANITAGITNLVFQKPADLSQSLISMNFASVSDAAKVSTIGLNEVSSFAPIVGNLSSAYQITVKPMTGTNPVAFVADIGLRAGESYTGNGADLELFQWNGSGWNQPAFFYNALNHMVQVSGATNASAFVIGQVAPISLGVQMQTNSVALSFTPIAGWHHTVERTTDFAQWTALSTVTPSDTTPIVVTDSAPPVGKAFYRLRFNRP